VSAADPGTLQELTTIKNGVLFSLAVRFGDTRLIDNFQLLA
jgi:pantothenate synthetase